MLELPRLTTVDWLVIGGFFLTSLAIGFYFSRKGSDTLADYFVAGRKMTWWVAGTSIVATSFAADTPLVIAGWMRTYGLERNWFWWGGVMGMMLCTFFFARLWRRAQILTDVEFNEIRYSGTPAAALRIFHASYRSLLQNTLVMGWVTLAMTKIIEVSIDLPTLVFLKDAWVPMLLHRGVDVSTAVNPSLIADWPLWGAAILPAKATAIIICFTSTALYTTLSGLWGVMATDLFQFAYAMAACFVLMGVVMAAAGGPQEMVAAARSSVDAGRVINRYVPDRAVVRATLGPAERGLLRAAGLIADSDGAARWMTNSLPETESIASLRREADVHRAEARSLAAAADAWRQTYLLPPGAIATSTVLDELIAAGLLQAEGGALAARGVSHRLTTLVVTPETLASLSDATRGQFLAALRGQTVVQASKITSFLPPFDLKGGGLMAIWTLVVFLGLQWWAGGEGGGFLAQRLFSCKNEKHAVGAMLWFNFTNFVVRPWPWIVVGVASLVLIPDVTAYGEDLDHEHAYVMMFMKYMPTGLRGMMVAALIAAYMSTISTHINFGASYVVNDLYRRFLRPSCGEHESLIVAKIVSLGLALLAGVYAFFAESIGTQWMTFFELMSGVGVVVLLRWYWWRISAWSEIAAMLSSLIMFSLLNYTSVFHEVFRIAGMPVHYLDEYAIRFTLNMTTTTLMWLAVTLLTPPEPMAKLDSFYRRVRPGGWWGPIARQAPDVHVPRVGATEWLAWALGVVAVVSMLAAAGQFCFGRYAWGVGLAMLGAACAIALLRLVPRLDWSDPDVIAAPQ